jgi:hypothetical protein
MKAASLVVFAKSFSSYACPYSMELAALKVPLQLQRHESKEVVRLVNSES